MLDIICKIIIVILVLIGLTEVCRTAILWLTKPHNPTNITLIIKIHGHNDEAESILRNTVEKIKWMGGKEEKKLICLNSNMDESTLKSCQIVKNQYNYVEICNEDELISYIS